MPTLAALLAWGLFVYGVVAVVTVGSLFRRLRLFPLFRCPLCFGWWIGLLTGWIFPSLGPGSYFTGFAPRVTIPVADAFAASALCWIVAVVLHALGSEQL